MDINKVKKVRNTLRLQYGGGISNPIPESISHVKIQIPEFSQLENNKQIKKDIEEYKKGYQTKNQSVGQVTSGIGTIAQGIGQAISTDQMATDSNLTKGITLGYNAVSDGLTSLGPIGKAASAIMKIAETTGDALQAIGGGTDQQSTLDKWMDSPFFSWNIGAVNGFFGKNTDSFAIDSDVATKVGGSYGGAINTLNNAVEKANKEYGLFSWKSRKKANDAIANAKIMQNTMSNIADTASDQRLAVQSMGEQAGLAYSIMTDGGFNQKYTYAAKEGGRLIPKCQKGSHAVFSHIVYDNPEVKKYVEPIIQIIDPTGISSYGDAYEAVKQATEDPNLKTFSNAALNVVGALPVIGKVTTGIKLGKTTKATQTLTNTTKNVNKVIDTVPELIPGVKQVAEKVQDLTSEYVVNPIFKKFVTKYDLNNMQDKVNTFINVVNGGNTTGDIVNAVQTYTETESKKKTTDNRPGKGIGLPSEKEGGLLEWHPVIELNWELPEYKEGGELLEWTPKFKNGGSISNSDIPVIEETTQKNVIPEGALHKNKHHMEHAEGLTKKGIPVIDDDGEQQAEIEHSEIIFTLEVTKKLEEYYQIFYSEESSNKEKEQAAIDAGKLLVYQILENTDDRTNLIESCKDGGTLKLKKSTDDLIEEALEWIPQIIVIEEETKEPKDKKKSEKEEMKETIKEVLIELLVK